MCQFIFIYQFQGCVSSSLYINFRGVSVHLYISISWVCQFIFIYQFQGCVSSSFIIIVRGEAVHLFLSISRNVHSIFIYQYLWVYHFIFIYQYLWAYHFIFIYQYLWAYHFIFIFHYLELSIKILCLPVCLFVINKRQNGWTDQVHILCGTSHAPRKGLWTIKNGEN